MSLPVGQRYGKRTSGSISQAIKPEEPATLAEITVVLYRGGRKFNPEMGGWTTLMESWKIHVVALREVPKEFIFPIAETYLRANKRRGFR